MEKRFIYVVSGSVGRTNREIHLGYYSSHKKAQGFITYEATGIDVERHTLVIKKELVL